ncbi:DUF3887 domain-containing protein [Actinophytocola sp. NPDC049390]|uniref:DUF3887 domain-containing protein n=1 Tax=Actinophytocola sp. NPDC049390 TaxID=3363894 RepID=UPI0037B7BBB3
MANVDDPHTCRNCGRSLPRQQGKGRIKQYCDATCRSAARRQRAKHGLTLETRQGYVDDGLTAVAEALGQARDAENALRRAVDEARASGRTWQEIGDVLDTSRQAAFQRFGRPVDPRTGTDTTGSDEPLPGAAEKAITLLADLVAGRWAEVGRDFDARMAAELTTDRIADAWAQVVGTFGAHERMGEPATLRVGGYTVVDVPLYCEANELTGRVSFDDDGAVTGLFLLPA